MPADETSPAESELDFATLAIAHRVLTREQVDAGLAAAGREMAEGKPKRPLEDVLLERGTLTSEQVWAVYKARDRLLRDARSHGQRIGGYELLEKIGEGGIGVVYKARQVSMGRLVALKVLHERWVGDDEFRKRFLVEARLVGRLSHPNLIQVIDVGRHRNQLFYSMEFVDGETLEARVERDGPMDPADALSVAFQVTRALQYLHNRRIIHRDVKPGNVMVMRSGQAKLADFGFVKSSLESVLSSEGEVLGTPDYISPEAARGERNLDFRSDLYSLGATLYHMMAGCPPFSGSGSSVMEAHIRLEPPPLSGLRPGLPARFMALIERLMRKNPAERHRTFEELLADLELLRLDLEADNPARRAGPGGPQAPGGEFGAGAPVPPNLLVEELRRREERLAGQVRRLRRLAAILGFFAAAAAIALACRILFFR